MTEKLLSEFRRRSLPLTLFYSAWVILSKNDISPAEAVDRAVRVGM